MHIQKHILTSLTIAAALAMPFGAFAENRPNILFIFADDHSFHDTGAYGNREVATPNIDRLADEGVLFTHAYNMGSYSPAVCIASRSMLLSGQTLWDAQSLDRDQWQEDEKFWPQQMKAAGYRTYMAGKWHVPNVNVREIFDTVRNPRPGMPNQTPEGYSRPLIESQEDPWSPHDPRFEGFWAGGTHWSEVLAEDAEIMLDDATSRDEPFFMYLCFNAPHDPRQAPKEYVDLYPQADVRIPDNYLPEYPYNEAMASGRNLRDERLAPFPRTVYATRVQRQEYYAIISHMDTQIGRILEALEASGEAENTWIVYASDHGLAVGQHGLMGKQNMYEHSLRVPFIMKAPELEAGKRIAAPIYLHDIVPTTLEIAGAEVPESVSFRSVLPLIRGERETSHSAIYGAYLRDRQRAVIDGRHKLILYPEISRLRLFDLEADPYEVVDLADDPDQEPVIRRLMARLKELQSKTNDPLDLNLAYPDW